MKLVLCALASLCLLAQAMHLPTQVADKTFLIKQKSIYELFWHVDQPTVYHPELYQKARTFNLLDNVDNFLDKEAITEFLEFLKHGMLPRGQVFSIMNQDMHHQAVVLFRVLYSAKDFDTFYNTAVWARFNVNEQMYIYSLCVAVMHRQDTEHIKLPPLYEVLPNFFFNEEVMHKAYQIAMGDLGVKKAAGGVDNYIIPANYSGWYMTRDNVPEQKLNYYTEDIGLNYYYFLVNQEYPYWMKSVDYKLTEQPRGEFYFFGHRQLLARYYLERLSNDLGEIENVDIVKPIVTGYYPSLHFRNGLPFPQREVNAVIPSHMKDYVLMVHDLHTRISNAIDLGYVETVDGKHVGIYTPEGLNILGNLVQGNADTVNQRFYGELDVAVRKVFGFGFESNVKYQIVPSALEIFCTSLRDPVFYSVYKNILNYYLRYKQNLPCYTQEQLTFPGVKIESVNVDKLMTYFDNFETMLNNGLSIRNHKEATSTLIKARQQRLNHKPFTYQVVVNSEKNTKAMCRVFLGPKFDVHGHEIDLTKNYMNFVELDQWLVDLKTGTNQIERSSHESAYVMADEVPSNIFYKKVVKAIEGTETFSYTTQNYGFPDRLLLPKGKKEGMTFQFVVVVSPVEDSKIFYINSPIWGRLVADGRAMGFPLDRPVEPNHIFVPNMYFKDVVIYHKEMEELNITA